MPNYLHRVTKEYLTSLSPAGLTEPAANYIMDPELSAVVGFESRYWTIVGDVVTLQTPVERDATDAAVLASQVAQEKGGAEAYYHLSQAESRVLRAVVVLLVDELNLLRTQWRSFQTATAVSNNLADIKTGVAGLPTLNNRTLAQAKSAIINSVQAE